MVRVKMPTINTIIFLIFIFSFVITLLLFYLDHSKKRIMTKKPFISFIIPVYNDGDTVEGTIKSIYSSYDKKKFEILVVNDKSKDNTAEALSRLSKKFNFKVFTNKRNMGKSKSINNVYKNSKGEIIFIIDADVILQKRNVQDLLARLENEQVGAASCRYKPSNGGFLPRMLELEYGLQTIIMTSHNVGSTIDLWGGCMAIKRVAFEEAGKLSVNMFSEDMDLALKLSEIGWRVEESSVPVWTFVPTNLKVWYKQKLRWGGGYAQNVFKHYKRILSHPVAIFFMLTYISLAFLFIIAAFNNLIFIKNLFLLFENLRDMGNSFLTSSVLLFKLANGYGLLESVAIYFLFPLFSLPYAIINIEKRKDWYKLLMVFPFAIIYLPIYTLANVHGIILGIKKYFTVKENEQGW